MAAAAGATKAFGTSTQGAGAAIGGLSSGAILAGGAIAGGLGIAVKSAFDFENALTRVRVNSNLTDAQINRMKGSILDLAGETGRAPKELAEALYFLASSGLDASQIMQTLERSAKASAAGLGETADIARLTANALNAYASEGLTATEVTDTLVAAVREGTAEPDEFANALGRILPIAQKAGVEFDEVTGSLAALSNIGLDVNEGVTAMRGLLQSLVAPTKQTEDALADLGLTTGELRSVISEQGIIAALRMLEERTGGNIDKLRDLIPNVRAITGAFGLTGQEAEKLDAGLRRVQNSTGDLDSAFQQWLKGPGADVARLLSNLQTLAIRFGNVALPPFMEIVGSLADMAENANEVLGILGDLVSLDFKKAGKAIFEHFESVGVGGGFDLGGALGEEDLKQMDMALNGIKGGLDAVTSAMQGAQVEAVRTRRTYGAFADSRADFKKFRDGVVEALDGVSNALESLSGDANVTAREWDRAMTRTVRSLNNYADNLKTVEKRNIPNALLKQILDMGTEGAGILEFLANASDREFKRYVGQAKGAERATDRVSGAIESLPKEVTVKFDETGLDELARKLGYTLAQMRAIAQGVTARVNLNLGGSGASAVSGGYRPPAGVRSLTPIPRSFAVGGDGVQTTIGGHTFVFNNHGVLGTGADTERWFEQTMRRVIRKP